MGVSFTRASSMRLVNSAPPLVSTGYPLTVGCWVSMLSVSSANNTVWAFSDTAVDNTTIQLLIQTTEIPSLSVEAGGVLSACQTTTAFTVGTWNFVVCRAIASANRRMAVLLPDGLLEHGSTVTARAPTSLDTFSIGMREDLTPNTPADAIVAEFWYTQTDIQADGGQLLESTLRQLAFGGPFSVPHIAGDILEYRSFRKYPTSDGDEIGEVFHGAAGRQFWTNTNGATIAPHPPLPYWYVKPGQIQTELVI